jgi:hypothetical protein
VTVLAVDLAAKYSAACLMDDDFTILGQFDSWQRTEEQFIYAIVTHWAFGVGEKQFPEILVIEDLPHGLKYSTLIKTVLRLQGRIVQAMHEMPNGMTEDILFAAPAEWRKTYDGMGRGTGPEIVVPVSERYGYVPPDLTDRAKGVKGGRAIARKVVTDYCSAYLIARWALTAKQQYGTYDIVGTSRYTTKAILKKDFNAENH